MAMQVVIQETGEVKTLSIIRREGGWESVKDLIGNHGALGQFNPEVDEDGEQTGRWVADADTFKWWKGYINDLEAIEDAIESLRDDLEEVIEYDEVQAMTQRVRNSIGDSNDVESVLSVAKHEIHRIRREYRLPEVKED